jgi:hypothetical protein
MKTPALILAVCLLMIVGACKKEKGSTPTNKIVGKWYVVKINIKQLAINNGPVIDTTYQGSTVINATDFFEFDNNDKAMLSVSGYFTVTGKSTATSAGQPTAGKAYYIYGISGSSLSLIATTENPTPGIATVAAFNENIIQLDNSNLVLQSNYNDTIHQGVITTYYTK